MAKKQIDRSIKDGNRSKEEDHSANFEFLSDFIAPKPTHQVEPVKLMDIVSGTTRHLNLKHVSRLEAQLNELYQHLNTLFVNMGSVWIPHACLLQDHSKLLVSTCLESLQDTMNQLISLSCLLPCAPLPLLPSIMTPGTLVLPSTNEFLQSLQLTPNSSAKLKDRLDHLFKTLEMDRVIQF